MRLGVIVIVLGISAAGQADSRWTKLADAPGDVELANLSVGPDLVAGANARAHDTGYVLRLHAGRWQRTKLVESEKPYELIGAWWIGKGLLELEWSTGLDVGNARYSRDGAKWTVVKGLANGLAMRLRPLPIWTAGSLVLAPADSEGIARSTDGGHSWEQIAPEGASISSVWGARATDVLAAGTKLLRSVDRGEHWTELPALGFQASSLAGSSARDIYALGTGGHQQHLAHSTDNGQTWTAISLPKDFVPPVKGPLDAGELAVTGKGDLWLAGHGVWHSNDAGKTWMKQELPDADYPILVAAGGKLYAVARTDKVDTIYAH